ncbi:hypothetical protein CI102_5291 [Trichoderma harzianum]|nr:hypothetical protein CI102_5291 [Trichoderma harzianum]
MKFSITLITLISTVLGHLGNIPSCAVNCIEQSVVKVTGCGSTDVDCACPHFDDIENDAIPCVISSQGCGPDANHDQIVAAAQALCAGHE